VRILGPVVFGLIGLGGGPGALIGSAATAVGVAKAVRTAQVERDRSRAAAHTTARGRRGKVMVGQIRYEWIKRIGATFPPSRTTSVLRRVSRQFWNS
jgi:hypothetical protein